MGLFSGDNINTICNGHDVTLTANVTAYDSDNGNALDTIPAGTDLGTCNNTKDDTTFFWGDWWLSFPAPGTPIGTNGGVNQAYWIKYDPSTFQVDGSTPQDNSGFNGLPESLQNLFGNITNLVITLVGIMVIFMGIFIYLNYYHNKK